MKCRLVSVAALAVTSLSLLSAPAARAEWVKRHPVEYYPVYTGENYGDGGWSNDYAVEVGCGSSISGTTGPDRITDGDSIEVFAYQYWDWEGGADPESGTYRIEGSASVWGMAQVSVQEGDSDSEAIARSDIQGHGGACEHDRHYGPDATPPVGIIIPDMDVINEFQIPPLESVREVPMQFRLKAATHGTITPFCTASATSGSKANATLGDPSLVRDPI
jgi:hypothetical protein